MTPVFIMMVGLPGSGKSTIAKTYGMKIFSSDEYRERFFGDVNDQTHNDKVFSMLHNDIRECLREGESCILDATNVSRKSRKRMLDFISSVPCFKKAHVVCPRLDTVFKQNDERDRKVPPDVIQRMLKQFEFPQLFEGFDEVYVTNNYDNYCEEELSNMFKAMSGFDQKNPHHIYDLASHCIRVANKFPHQDIRHDVGYIHDIGKLTTQTFDDKGIAHYYNHDNVGTYIVASLTDFGDVVSYRNLLKLFFINYHMRAHNDFCTPKAESKYRHLFGDDLFDSLMEFAEADRESTGTYEGRKDVRPGIN